MISAIVITCNRVKSLERCIKSILNQSYKDYEIVIIDDGSTDNTSQIIKELQKKNDSIRYFKQKNKGRGSARNLGLSNAKGGIIAFTDDDCIVDLNWLKNIKIIFENHPDVSAGGGSILNKNKNPFSEAAHILNFSSWISIGEKKYVKDIPTANIAYKKDCINRVKFPIKHGNLDYEDSFFNNHLIKKGKKILFDPAIKVYHNPKINDYDNFLKNQQRKALSFLLHGYKLHGFAGKMLVKFKLLNLFCPRLLLVLLRCFKSSDYRYKAVAYFPLIIRGELERGLTIIHNKNKLK